MEGQREKTSSRRRQRRKSKTARSKAVVEPVLIVARRPDSPLLKNGFHNVIASAQPKHSGNGHSGTGQRASGIQFSSRAVADELDANGHALGSEATASAEASLDGHAATDGDGSNADLFSADGLGSSDNLLYSAAGEASDLSDRALSEAQPLSDPQRGDGVRRRAVRIVKLADSSLGPGNREQQLLDRLVRSQGRGAISRAANDLWESKFVAPRQQEVQIQLLEHENEIRARDAVFIIAELLQREPPIKRPVLDQRLRRLEQSAEDPITRDAAGALRRSMRVHHGM
jgi:hypothetical protein